MSSCTPHILLQTTQRGALATLVAACVSGLAAAQADVTLSLVGAGPHAEAGQSLDIRIHMAASTSPAPALLGAQLVVHFDPSILEPAAASMVESIETGPLPALSACVVDPNGGSICFFVFDPTFAGSTASSGDLAMLHFRVKQDVERCLVEELVRFGTTENLSTSLATLDQTSPSLDLVSLPTMNLDRTPPVLSGIPASTTVATDAGSTVGALIAPFAVVATDNCDPDVAVVCTVSLPDGQQSATWPARFPIGTSTVRWSATDSTGHTATDERTITVTNHQLMDAVVHLQGTFDQESLGFDRLVRFKTGSSVQTRSVTFDPITRSGSVSDLEVPVAESYPCVSAKDPVHSLSDSSAATVAGVKYLADFNLTLGDSNDDDLVDIVDFTYFVFDHGVAAGDGRSNFNADAFVNTEDFTYIALNFFKVGQSCGAFTAGQPRDRLTVKELRRMGLGHLAAADLNRDGVVDLRDIQNYLGGGGAQPGTSQEPPARR